jgi:hypothetical protein
LHSSVLKINRSIDRSSSRIRDFVRSVVDIAIVRWKEVPMIDRSEMSGNDIVSQNIYGPASTKPCATSDVPVTNEGKFAAEEPAFFWE